MNIDTALIARVRELEAAQPTLAVQLQRLAPTWSHETKSWTMREAEDGPYTLWSAAAETIRVTMWERNEAKAHVVCLEALLREKTEECDELDEERREAWQHVQSNMSHVFLKGAHGALADAGGVEVPPLTKPIDETIRAIVRERDEMRCRVRELEAERDEARAQLAAHDTGAPCDGHRHCCADRRKLAEELLRVRAERDALKEKPCA